MNHHNQLPENETKAIRAQGAAVVRKELEKVGEPAGASNNGKALQKPQDARKRATSRSTGPSFAASREVPGFTPEEEAGFDQSDPLSKLKLPDPVSASAFCADPPATPETLIDGLMYRGGTLLFTGGSKSMKTWSLLDLGVAVATGTPWLGFETTKAPVIYANLELPPFVLANRLQILADNRRVRVPENLLLWNLRTETVTIDKFEINAPAIFKKNGRGLIIVDPHYKISATSGFEENSNDSQGALLSRLEVLTSQHETALALCHHMAKGRQDEKNVLDLASGGGVFARWPDAFMAMREHEEEGAVVLDTRVRAFPPVDSRVLRWEFPMWIDEPTLDPTKLKKPGRGLTRTREAALAALVDGMSYAEWRQALDWPETSFRRRRTDLLDSRKVTEVCGIYHHAK